MSSAKLKKAQFYVWYLGWKECGGLAGREFTEPVARELLLRGSQEELPKLTIEVGKKELKITQLAEKKKGKIEKIKYPSIANRDITFAEQCLHPFDDIVSCIYLGFNNKTKSAVHVHNYRFDSPDTAAIFVNHVQGYSQIPENQARIRGIEDELVKKGQIQRSRPESERRFSDENDDYFDYSITQDRNSYQAGGFYAAENGEKRRSGASNGRSYSSGSDPPVSPHSSSGNGDINEHSFNNNTRLSASQPQARVYTSDRRASSPARLLRHAQQMQSNEIDSEQQIEFETLANELKSKLGKQPLLLPPKDYDTMHRQKGNAYDIINRKCMNQEIIGQYGYSSEKIVHQAKNDENIGIGDIKENSNYKSSVNDKQQQQNQGERGLKKQGSQSSFGESNNNNVSKKSSSNGSWEETPGYNAISSGRNGKARHSRQISADGSIPDDVLNQHVPPPFSPGNTSFPQKGLDLPNHLQRSQGSNYSLGRYSTGEDSTSFEREQEFGANYNSPSSYKYSASSLGLAGAAPPVLNKSQQRHHQKMLMKQQSSPEFRHTALSVNSGNGFGSSGGHPGGLRRQYSNDSEEQRFLNSSLNSSGGKYQHNYSSTTQNSGHSSGSNTMNSNAYTDSRNTGSNGLATGQVMEQQSKGMYVDEDDPGSYIPIDYTVAARGVKTRKAIP